MEAVQNGTIVEEMQKTEEALRLILKVSEEGLKSVLLEIMHAAVGVEREILECALNQKKMEEYFPEKILFKSHLVDDSARLRYEKGRCWSRVITGRIDNEVDEKYNYLRLVQIPKMAFQILKTMDAESAMVLAALTEKQYAMYRELGSLAREVLGNAIAELGEGRMSSLMKVDVPVLRQILEQPSF